METELKLWKNKVEEYESTILMYKSKMKCQDINNLSLKNELSKITNDDSYNVFLVIKIDQRWVQSP